MNLKETNIRLIQASLGRSGSTVLSNILQGLFYPTKPLAFRMFRKQQKIIDALSDNFVIKTHHRNAADVINQACGNTYEYWIISSSRDSKIYQCAHSNFISFEYEQLLETETNSVEIIVDTVAQKLKAVLPHSITHHMDVNGSINRIKEMNTFYETIKTQRFGYFDNFYCIHGKHRRTTYFASLSDNSVVVNIMSPGISKADRKNKKKKEFMRNKPVQ